MGRPLPKEAMTLEALLLPGRENTETPSLLLADRSVHSFFLGVKMRRSLLARFPSLTRSLSHATPALAR